MPGGPGTEQTMTGFKVTASNKGFWQILKVNATDADGALAQVRAYLAQPAQQRVEEQEYQDAQATAADYGTEPEPGDFEYRVSDRDVEELDAPISSSGVLFVDAGGNG